MENNSDIKIYEGEKGNVRVEVRLENESVWLTQKEIVQLFETDQSVISRHINNIFKSGELDKKSNMQKMHIANSDKDVSFFNLDVVLSVGYRVNSKKATAFRIWANKILKDYLVKGYAVNQKRLKEQAKYFKELQQANRFSYFCLLFSSK